MDEYSNAVMKIIVEIYGANTISEHMYEKMEKEHLADAVLNLKNIGLDDIADAASLGNHKLIDEKSMNSLINVVHMVNKHLPSNLASVLAMLYDTWYMYVLKNEALDKEIIQLDKNEFNEYLMEKIKDMCKNFSKDDIKKIMLLTEYVLYNKEFAVPEENVNEGIWPIVNMLYKKTMETKRISSFLHYMLLREQIWKEKLFVR